MVALTYGRILAALLLVFIICFPDQIGASADRWDADGKAMAEIARKINPRLTREESQKVGSSFEKWYRAYHLESRAKAIAMVNLESSFHPKEIGDHGKSIGLCQVNFAAHGKALHVSRKALFDIDTNFRFGFLLWKWADEKYPKYNPPKAKDAAYYRKIYDKSLTEVKRYL